MQEAVDFTLIARKAAELALVPALVAMDYEDTALAAQDVRLPSVELIQRYLGMADGEIAAPTPAQELLYGKQRRRMPRSHDPDAPLLQGAVQDSRSFALGAMAGAPFFDGHFDAILQGAFDEFAGLTGRRYNAVSAHRVADADRLLLAQGSAVEAAKALADQLSLNRKERLGVVGIHCLRPFPGAALTSLLAGKRWVAVMERLAAPLDATPPLLRELRNAFDCALDNKRFGAETHPGYPALEERQRPRLQSVIYGVGGLPLTGPDLLALVERVEKTPAPTLYLGMGFHANLPEHPKRQVMLDQLRRAYPRIASLGVTSNRLTATSKGRLALAFRHSGDAAGRLLCAGAGGLLQRLQGGSLRSKPGLDGDGWQSCNTDLLLHSTTGLGVCDESNLADALLLNGAASLQGIDLNKAVRPGALLLFAGFDAAAAPLAGLSAANRDAVKRLGLKPYLLPSLDAGLEDTSAWLTGGLFGALAGAEVLDLSPRKAATAWKEGLAALPDREQEQIAERFKTAMESVQPLTLEGSAAQPTAAAWSDEPPIAVRHLGGNGDTNESLPRFWDQVGVLYRDGEGQQLTADPYLATGSVPPLSATFQDHSSRNALGIRFDGECCTGCGDCFAVCPDSAIGVSAVTPVRLIETAIGFTAADALRPLAGKLGARINAMARKGEFRSASAADLLGEAWAWMQAKAPLPEERRVNVETALGWVRDWLGALPLVVTEALFHDGEKARKDGGELLSLAINPDACKGCGLCVAQCGEGALVPAPWNPAEAKGLWRVWERTPDTASETIERLSREGRLDGLSALMLSRFCSHALSGGDFAEAGSGERLALRQLLAAAEYQQQPLLHRFTAELGEAKQRVDGLIRDTLAEALPTDDLDRLAAALNGDQGFDIGALVKNPPGADFRASPGGERRRDASNKSAGEAVDIRKVRRLIDLAKGLHDQHWRLSTGKHGLGRSRYGLAISTGTVAAWAAAFPHNPFQAPVAVDMTGDAAQLASGLVQGQAVETLRAINLLAQASHLLGGRSRHPASRDTSPSLDVDSREAPAELGWDDLSEEQRRLCPPLILVGNEKELGGRGLAQMTWLLNSGLPVKVLLLSELDLGLDGLGVGRPSGRHAGLKAGLHNGINDPRSDLGLLALAQRNAYVAQGSIAHPGHLHRALREALRFGGPALIRVHAPSPRRHGFAPDRTLVQARLAVETRVLPLFRYDPEAEGVFGSRIDLEGNGDPHAPWNDDRTPVDWALGEARFRGHIQPLSEADKGPTALTAWLALAPQARKGKTPMATLEGKNYRLSLEFAGRIERLAANWRLLQELAGVETPFTERVRREAEAAVAEAHQSELAALRAEYESRLNAQAEGLQTELAGRIKQRLMNLAGYH
ncbi:MAG: hypothetical protein A2514_15540 [Gammaproteobacteria bacterium RIFOXYD12_FULL_61_37]|nr:MAG: hypothetical protein A2514_15540 [Gammaproteobacteria bacterium RIFOXYD12_FULL_61_37]